MVSLSHNVQLPAVSGFAFSVFFLNTLMHPADKGSTCCNNFVKTNRCKKNSLFFISNYFMFYDNEWRFIDAYDSIRIAAMFPGLSFVRTLVVDGDRLVNEEDGMAAAGEVDCDNVHFALEVAFNNTVSYTAFFGPLTFGPCLRFSAFPVGVVPVPGTWLTNQCQPNSSSLKHFFDVLMAASVYTPEYVPMSCPTKLHRRTSPTTIATRKISWFLEPMGEVSLEMLVFCHSYASDHKFDDPNFPRVYRRVTEIHISRVGGSPASRVSARKHRRNGRLI
ncbi:hypothetical protein INT47_005866 [Mucor saturninus]|uniref:Uncharacterized protein n=1 Tax=Mucor saturninus TaxID=64648 RepID=A0A8H7QJT6_9FUNG|nr:hypothetical protein INT47_005866 [Mucor saturninus]